MKAIVWDKDFDTGLWQTNGEVFVVKETDKSIKVRRWYSLFSTWYPKNSIGIRFEIIEEK